MKDETKLLTDTGWVPVVFSSEGSQLTVWIDPENKNAILPQEAAAMIQRGRIKLKQQGF